MPDQLVDMCTKGLSCPDTQRPMRWRTRLRASKLFSRELLTLCGGHGRLDHREITGKLRDGTARSALGKVYTVDFSTDLVDELVMANSSDSEDDVDVLFATTTRAQGDAERRQSQSTDYDESEDCECEEPFEIFTNFGKITCKGCIAKAKGKTGILKHAENKTCRIWCKRQERNRWRQSVAKRQKERAKGSLGMPSSGSTSAPPPKTGWKKRPRAKAAAGGAAAANPEKDVEMEGELETGHEP